MFSESFNIDFHARKCLNQNFLKILLIAVLVFAGTVFYHAQVSEAASVKITYNSKSHTNTSKRYKIKYEGTSVSNSGFEAIEISSVYLMPYEDIIVDAMKFETSYDSDTGAVSITHNDTTIEMTVGSKKALINGKSVTMPIKPLLVTFEAKKKTKLMLPIDFITSNLHLYNRRTSSAYSIKEPLIITDIEGNPSYYSDIRGQISYNNTKYTASKARVMNIDSVHQVSAVALFNNVFGYETEFNIETGEFSAYDKDLKTMVLFKVGDQSFTIRQGEEEKSYTIKTVITSIKAPGKDYEPFVPIVDVLKALGLTYEWSAEDNYYYIHAVSYFDWSGDVADDAIVNSIYSAKGKYDLVGEVGFVDLEFTGDMQDSFDRITIDRSDKIISITIPNSTYTPDLTSYDRFGEIVNSLSITENDNSVTISVDCVEVTEFSYTTSDKKLSLKLLWDYSTASGKITNYSLTIPRPSGVLMSSVTNTECYDAVSYKKRFKITIKGDHVKFFKSNPVIINNSSVSKISIALNSSGNTVITVDTKTLQGYKIYRNGDNFVVSMNTPRKIYKNILVLDAGHGGYDSGASNKGTYEKDLTLKMIYTLMKGYVNKNAGDLHVYWTRRTDKYITLSARAKFASKCKADAFISLHMNAASTSANGTEVYYSVNNNKTSFSGITSNKMATLMKNRLISNLGTVNRGVKTAGFYVIKYNSVPSILVELAFLTGSQDYKRLTNTTFQKKATKTIYNTIEEMFKTYDTGR